MPTAEDFQSFTAAVFPSPTTEIMLAKQPALAEHGTGLRAVISQLPPECSRALLGEYGVAGPETVNSIESALLRREFAMELAQQASPSQQWLNEVDGHGKGIDESMAAADDAWNRPS